MFQPYSPVVRVTPAIQTGAYEANDVVGGILTVPCFAKTKTGVLKNINVKDLANQKATTLAFLLFDKLPVGTYTDGAAFAWTAADKDKCIGIVNVAAADYTSVDGVAIASKECAIAVRNSDDDAKQDDANKRCIYVIVVTTGTPTYGNAAALQLQFGFLNDG